MAERVTKSSGKFLWVLSSFEMGAPQRRLAALISRLGRAEGADRFEHVICVLDGQAGAQTLIEPGANWRMLQPGGGKPRKRGALSLGKLWSSRRSLASERPDLLITVGLGAIDWLAVNRGPGSAPHLHIQDPIGPEEALEGDDRRGDWTRRKAFSGRDRAFVAEGDEIAELLTSRWGAPPDAVRRMPWGVDIGLVKRAPRGDRAGVVLGSLTPLIPEKRHDRLLRILASLRERGREASARLVGQGPERRRLEVLADSLGLADHVEFVDQDGLDPRIAAAETAQMDVFVDLADVARSPAPGVLALAAGLPILATDTSATAALAPREGALFLRAAQDESALAAAAELLAADAGLRDSLGEAGRALAEKRHELGAMVAAFEALVDEMRGGAGLLALPAPQPEPQSEIRSTAAPAESAKPAGEADAAPRPTPIEAFLAGREPEASPAPKKKLTKTEPRTLAERAAE